MNLMGAISGLSGFTNGFLDSREQQESMDLKKQLLQMQMEQAQWERGQQERSLAQQNTNKVGMFKMLNPDRATELTGGTGNREMSRMNAMPDAETQVSAYKIQKDVGDAQKQRESIAWYFSGGAKTDPTGERFAAQRGYNPLGYVGDKALTAAENRENQRAMQEERLQQALMLKAMLGGSGGGVGTWSATPNGMGLFNSKTGQVQPLPEGFQNTQKGSTPFQKSFGEKAVKDYFTMQGKAEDASNSLAGIDSAQSAVDSGIYTGFGGDAVQLGRRALAAVGMGDTNTVASAEELAKIQAEMALIARNPNSGLGLPGAASDKDMAILMSMGAGLDKNPETNRRFLAAARKVKERQIEVANAANKYVEENGQLDQNFYSGLREWANRNSMFEGIDSPQQQTQQAAPATQRPGKLTSASPRAQTLINQYGGNR
jgi:hypothetical protein